MLTDSVGQEFAQDTLGRLISTPLGVNRVGLNGPRSPEGLFALSLEQLEVLGQLSLSLYSV
jgi:hypothetical protein